MTIKHLVIAGGGLLGFRYFGALKRLEKSEFWKRENIESIYATSVGSIIGACIILKHDWETLEQFIVEKPWQDEFVVSGKQIFDTYSTKGLYSNKLFEAIFKPLLGAAELSIDITLQQLYEFNPVDFHIYTFELNSYKTIDLSHTTHPELKLLDAITMSSAIPGLIRPIIIDNCCYIDGGIEYNYPLKFCLEHKEFIYTNTNTNTNTDANTNTNTNTNTDANHYLEEILGLQSLLHTEELLNQVTSDTNILDFFIKFSINTIIHLTKIHNQNNRLLHIPNEMICSHNGESMTLEYWHDVLRTKDKRRQLILDGEADAQLFIEKKKQDKDKDKDKEPDTE